MLSIEQNEHCFYLKTMGSSLLFIKTIQKRVKVLIRYDFNYEILSALLLGRCVYVQIDGPPFCVGGLGGL